MNRDDAFKIGRLDGHDQATLVRRAEVSAPELIEAAITRIEMLNPQLNAVVHPLFDSGRARAAGPGGIGILDRVPILLKESSQLNQSVV